MDQGYLDLYCERVGPGFWAEPINAASNLGFIVVAVILILALCRQKSAANVGAAVWSLIGLTILIGIGSGLFHTFAVNWAKWADVIPITLFILIYSFLALRIFAHASVVASVLWAGLVLILTAGLPALTGVRGTTYVPALIGIFALVTFLQASNKSSSTATALLAAGGLFALSLGFRTLDLPLCEFVPVGTHFLWHILNAVMLFILIRAMVEASGLGTRGA